MLMNHLCQTIQLITFSSYLGRFEGCKKAMTPSITGGGLISYQQSPSPPSTHPKLLRRFQIQPSTVLIKSPPCNSCDCVEDPWQTDRQTEYPDPPGSGFPAGLVWLSIRQDIMDTDPNFLYNRNDCMRTNWNQALQVYNLHKKPRASFQYRCLLMACLIQPVIFHLIHSWPTSSPKSNLINRV